MAISKQLKDEADRTIAGITDYYEKYGDALVDAEEREHRISKVASALEGCNGLTEKEKIQKTAENLFGLTCTWERDSLALKRELLLSREETAKAFDKSKKETAEEFTKLGATVTALDSKLDTVTSELSLLAKELKTLTQNNVLPPPMFAQPQITAKPLEQDMTVSWHTKFLGLIDTHFGTTVFFVIVVLLLLIFSGNLDWLSTLLPNKS